MTYPTQQEKKPNDFPQMGADFEMIEKQQQEQQELLEQIRDKVRRIDGAFEFAPCDVAENADKVSEWNVKQHLIYVKRRNSASILGFTDTAFFSFIFTCLLVCLKSPVLF